MRFKVNRAISGAYGAAGTSSLNISKELAAAPDTFELHLVAQLWMDFDETLYPGVKTPGKSENVSGF